MNYQADKTPLVPLDPQPLDRKSAVPLYHQLFIDLRRQITDGRWKSGDPFPKDSDIEAVYDVSRITVRQAVAQLVDANLVIRFRGRGSFVANLSRVDAPINHRRIRDEISGLGMTPTHEVLGDIQVYQVSDLTAQQMHCDVGDKVQILRRLHYADGDPFCIETIMLLVKSYPDFFARFMAGDETLTDAYRRHGVKVIKCEQTVQASSLSDDRRKLLDLPTGVPALVVERVGFDEGNEPIDVRRILYRSDRYSLRQEILWDDPLD